MAKGACRAPVARVARASHDGSQAVTTGQLVTRCARSLRASPDRCARLHYVVCGHDGTAGRARSLALLACARKRSRRFARRWSRRGRSQAAVTTVRAPPVAPLAVTTGQVASSSGRKGVAGHDRARYSLHYCAGHFVYFLVRSCVARVHSCHSLRSFADYVV